MRRVLALAVTSLLPLCAAAQALPGDTHEMAARLLAQQPDQMAEVQPGVVVPLWRGADGRMLMLRADEQPAGTLAANAPLSFSVVDAGSALSNSLSYQLAPSLQAHAGVTEHSWANAPYRVLGSELGATYTAGRYSLGVSVGADAANGASRLPRVLPGAIPGSVNGLPSFGTSTQFNARGRVALDGTSGIDLGASVGRIHLLPGNLLGVDTLDQKALSVGIDRGPLSGSLVGRVMQPSAGIPGAYSPDRRWSSIDFGVTFKLPWQGQLSVGAQNLWSSGTPANTPAGPEPDQSRTPYVQYHQDL